MIVAFLFCVLDLSTSLQELPLIQPRLLKSLEVPSKYEVVSATPQRLLLFFNDSSRKKLLTADWNLNLGPAVEYGTDFDSQQWSRDGKYITGPRFISEPMQPYIPITDINHFIYFDGKSKRLRTAENSRGFAPHFLNEAGPQGQPETSRVKFDEYSSKLFPYRLDTNTDFILNQFWMDENYSFATYWKCYNDTDEPRKTISFTQVNGIRVPIKSALNQEGFEAQIPFGEWFYGKVESDRLYRANTESIEPLRLPPGISPKSVVLVQVSGDWILASVKQRKDTSDEFECFLIAYSTNNILKVRKIPLGISSAYPDIRVIAIPFSNRFLVISADNSAKQNAPSLIQIFEIPK